MHVLLALADPEEEEALARALRAAGHVVARPPSALGSEISLATAEHEIAVTDAQTLRACGDLLALWRASDLGALSPFLLVLCDPREVDSLVVVAECGGLLLPRPIAPETVARRIEGARRVVELKRDMRRGRALAREKVTKLHALNRLLREEAMHDDLTGFLVGAAACATLEEAWATGGPLSVLSLAIEAGERLPREREERLLVDVSDAVRAVVRRADVCLRPRSDELVVLCRGAGLATAREVATRIERSVRRSVGTYGSCEVLVGAAERDEGTRTVDELLRRAARARQGAAGRPAA